MTKYWIAQILGFLAIGITCVVFSRTKKEKMLFFKILQDVLWTAHYLLLGLWTPVATSLVSVTRSSVYLICGKKKASPAIPALFLGLNILCGLLTWDNVYSILPVFAYCLPVIGFWMKNPRHVKMVQIPSSMLTFTYNVLCAHSVSVYVSTVMSITTSAISLWLTREHKEEKQNEG